MKLRTKLLALSLLTLLLPWSGWKLLQELEQFLRDAQQGALLASARTVAGALPLEYQNRLLFLPELYVPLRTLQRQPALDGYRDDWPGAGQGLEFDSGDDALSVSVLAGDHSGRLFILFDIIRKDGGANSSASLQEGSGSASMTLLVRSPRGLFTFTINPGAPGPIQLYSERGDSGQLDGYWLDPLEPGSTEVAVIEEFPWPEGAGEGSLRFHAALTDEAVTAVMGTTDSVEFGFGR